MNIQATASKAGGTAQSVGIADCDIHPNFSSSDEFRSYLDPAWRGHYDQFHNGNRAAFASLDPYPGIEPNIARRDSYPDNGGPPGSDLDFMRRQHLDAHDVKLGLLQPLSPSGAWQRDQAYGAAISAAVNRWQLERWTQDEPRLKGSITIPQDNAEMAVAEIRRHAGNGDFVQVAMSQRALEPLGRRRYWPIYQAAVEAGLPIGIHVGGNGGAPVFGGAGWASFHIQQHQAIHYAMNAMMTSFVMEGVFETFPGLRIMLVEGAFSWLPSAMWRMDAIWEKMRAELSHLKRPPSEYVRRHVWVSTQPIDVYKDPKDLRQIMEWIGFDRLCFASDYPHWDFDDPRYAFPFAMTEAEKAQIFRQNTMAFLGRS